jgi:hypothetical protein
MDLAEFTSDYVRAARESDPAALRRGRTHLATLVAEAYAEANEDLAGLSDEALDDVIHGSLIPQIEYYLA